MTAELYKFQNEYSSTAENGDEIKDEINYFQFIFFCTEINQSHQKANFPKLIELIQGFADFLRNFGPNTNFPLEFIIDNNIPNICHGILKSDDSYQAYFLTISFILDLFYTCEGATNLFSSDEFLDTISTSVTKLSSPLVNSYIRALQDIILNEDVSRRDFILTTLPLDVFCSFMMKDRLNANFITDCLNFLIAILQNHLHNEGLMLILRTANYFLSDYPISCLKIYILLIQHHNIYDGYNYQDVLPFLDIDNSSDYHKASENAIMTCKFIATVLQYNNSLQGCFPNDQLAKIALTSTYDNNLRYYSLLALKYTDHYSLFIQNMISLFDCFSEKCKQVAGLMILDYAIKVSSETVGQLITPEKNIFTIVRILFDTHSLTVIKDGYLAMYHFFDITNSDDNTIAMFLEEFPDDTIWHYSHTDDDEINQIAERFISRYLSTDDSD